VLLCSLAVIITNKNVSSKYNLMVKHAGCLSIIHIAVNHSFPSSSMTQASEKVPIMT